MEIFKCHQFRVNYTPNRQFENNTSIWDIRWVLNPAIISDKVVIWASETMNGPTSQGLKSQLIQRQGRHWRMKRSLRTRHCWLTSRLVIRYLLQVMYALKQEQGIYNILRFKPENFRSLVSGWDLSIKLFWQGCGYPPSVDCDVFTEKYNNISDVSMPTLFVFFNQWSIIHRRRPPSPATIQPWTPGLSLPDTTSMNETEFVLYNLFMLIFRDDTVTSILVSILVPNVIFVVSVATLVYW